MLKMCILKINCEFLFCFQVPDEESLNKINDELKSNNVDFYRWLEQPDNIHTCIALRPYPKSQVENYFKSLKLFRN